MEFCKSKGLVLNLSSITDLLLWIFSLSQNTKICRELPSNSNYCWLIWVYCDVWRRALYFRWFILTFVQSSPVQHRGAAVDCRERVSVEGARPDGDTSEVHLLKDHVRGQTLFQWNWVGSTHETNLSPRLPSPATDTGSTAWSC